MFQHFIKKGLIGSEALQPLIDHERVRVLDASYALPNSGINPQENFQQKRIPGAQFFDISQISDQNSHLPHMLPSAAEFEETLCGLGIHNDDLVVIYGQSDMAMGPARAWWMFRVFGHHNVVVLDGGLPAWAAAGGGFESSPTRQSTRSTYRVQSVRDDLVADMEKVGQASKQKLCPILDARPQSRFDGTQAEPRVGMRSGHIPNSSNIPASTLLDPATGKMKTEAELERIFSDAGIKQGSEIILTCGSGVTACMLALGLFSLGFERFSVYDGSWSEWGSENSGMPVTT